MSNYRFNIGIRAHDLNGCPFENADDIIKELKENDLEYLQLVYKKAFSNFTMDYDFLKEVNGVFENNGIKVAMVGAYFNMIHPDEKKREDGINYFIECMKTAHIFNTKYVGSETGSMNGDEWTYNPLNQTIETYNNLKNTINEILSKTPANRWGKTSDLVGPAVFLASSASDFVNGHILYVDGGILAYIGKQPQ